jgi:hypothetical protein
MERPLDEMVTKQVGDIRVLPEAEMGCVAQSRMIILNRRVK